MKRDLVAILRGVEPSNAIPIAEALIDAGFGAVEIPLNSPGAFDSIAAVVKEFGDRALIGAGTVLATSDVLRLNDVGGRLLVAPNVDPTVLQQAASLGMVTLPGVLSPTEAFTALTVGASGLKFFPASVIGASGIKAISAVLPKDTVIAAVGGISESDFAAYGRQGIRTFGLGSSLFRPGMSVHEVATRAEKAVAAWDAVFRA